jgi:hypothetical protein
MEIQPFLRTLIAEVEAEQGIKVFKSTVEVL